MLLTITINVLLAIHVIVSLLIILVTLMQRPKSEGLGAAFGGGMTENIFGAQTTNVLATFTRWMAGVFFALTLTLSVLYAKQSSQKSATFEKLAREPKPAPAPVVPPVPKPAASPGASAPAIKPATSPSPQTPAATQPVTPPPAAPTPAAVKPAAPEPAAPTSSEPTAPPPAPAAPAPAAVKPAAPAPAAPTSPEPAAPQPAPDAGSNKPQ